MLICAAPGYPDHGSLSAGPSFSFATEPGEMVRETFMTFLNMNMHLVTGDNIMNYLFVCTVLCTHIVSCTLLSGALC